MHVSFADMYELVTVNESRHTGDEAMSLSSLSSLVSLSSLSSLVSHLSHLSRRSSLSSLSSDSFISSSLSSPFKHETMPCHTCKYRSVASAGVDWKTWSSIVCVPACYVLFCVVWLWNMFSCVIEDKFLLWGGFY